MASVELFPIGARVVVHGHWEFPDGTTGTIAEVPEGVHDVRNSTERNFLFYEERTRHGVDVVQWVVFDEPTDDGTGDGPYRAGGIATANLLPLRRS